MVDSSLTTNRLIHSSSPYLLQHAHNPIDWYPWGEEAIERAKREDKPIFVSIGYSTCYWCHVMEREVFCNPEIGALMNSCFVNIKVDREERPDIDDIYMVARQLLTRQGGWPNNVILTPEKKPFWAGGTLAVDNRYGPSFPDLALWLAENWKNNRDQIEKTAEEITHYLSLQLTEARKPSNDVLPDYRLSEQLVEKLTGYADKKHGGFFNAPKFPHETYLLFLLDHYRITKNRTALALVTKTLDGLAAGGIHDHVGGGFHRYAVDAEWNVPHFEKMLYNQALLGRCFTEAYIATNNPYYRHVAETTYGFVKELFTGTNGQFYSALDAETDAVEGAYYVWTPCDIKEALYHDQEDMFFSSFTLADVPEFAGHKHPEGGVMTTMNPAILQQSPPLLLKALEYLKKERDKRKMPMLDTKVITAWHAMMMNSLAMAGKLLDHADYLTMAETAAGFIERSLLMEDGRLLRIAPNGHGKDRIFGFLEDYAHTMQGLLSLYEATGNSHYLTQTLRLAETCFRLFEDNEHGGCFFTEEASDLLRIKTANDDALPSANAIMLQNLVTLARITKDPLWITKAEQLLAAFYDEIGRSPISYTSMLHGFQQLILLLKGPSLAGETTVSLVQATVISPVATIKKNELFSVTIKLRIAEGWQLSKETTSLTLTHPQIILHTIHLPEGNDYHDEIFITADVSLKDAAIPDHTEIITAVVTFQPCNDRSCSAPEKLAITIPLKVV